ncbi:MAG: porin family protein [Bacteroidota bacterium]
MRFFLLFFVQLVFFNLAQSQHSFGIRSGFHSSKVKFFVNDDFLENSDALNQFEIGLFYNKKIHEHFALTPELNYLERGGSIPGSISTEETHYNQLELVVPITLQFRVKRFVPFAKLGLSYGYTLSGFTRTALSRRELDFSDNDAYKRSDFGLVVGGGTHFLVTDSWGIFLEYRYRESFSYTMDAELEDIRLSTKNRGQGLVLGVMLTLSPD